VKTINFNKAILSMDGNPMKKDADKPLMMKDVVGNTVCVSKARKPDEVVRQLNVGMEIYRSTGEIQLEDSDFKLVRDIISVSDLSTLVLGQIVKEMDNSEKQVETNK
jgi:hypothetical protein